MIKQWYELSEEERIKQVYIKYTINDFWNWWSDKSNRFMEIRIKDYQLVKYIGQKHQIPYSKSGVYVFNAMLLKKVIVDIRKHTTCWFGINPKKRNWNKWGTKSFSGKDENIDSINFIFIDIDRITKEKRPATNEELKNADTLSELILLAFRNNKWGKSYCKICSGNGVQLLIKLDKPIQMPIKIFNKHTQDFEPKDEFDKTKNIIKHGIGEQLSKYSKQHKKQLKTAVDPSCFNIGRVAALPWTKNFKYNGFTWRGVLDIQNGINDGLTNYLIETQEYVLSKKPYKGIFINSNGSALHNILTAKDIKKHPLTLFLLKNDLPKGEGVINNKLWFMFKALLRENKLTFSMPEIQKLHKEIEKNYGKTLTTNFPDKNIKYNPDVINKVCREWLIPPIFELWENRGVYKNRTEMYNWDDIKVYIGKSIKCENDDPLEDCKEFKKEYIIQHENKIFGGVDKLYNKKALMGFTVGLIEKYGKKVAKYYSDYIYHKFFNYDYGNENMIS